VGGVVVIGIDGKWHLPSVKAVQQGTTADPESCSKTRPLPGAVNMFLTANNLSLWLADLPWRGKSSATPKEEPEKMLKLHDIHLYRNVADNAFLALVVAINTYIEAKQGITPRSHTVRRQMPSKIGREDLRAAYSDLMRTLREETYHEGVYQPEEVRYAVEKVGEIIDALEKEAT